ncbi:hypothetical protein [Aureivirga marina]|uniref:hypothetical protein n=1 Tax=Aureivirga marina TaxID=1182451 RepID=UPI0018C97FD0|nr:hypothetical protein [Aureivirga marina]
MKFTTYIFFLCFFLYNSSKNCKQNEQDLCYIVKSPVNVSTNWLNNPKKGKIIVDQQVGYYKKFYTTYDYIKHRIHLKYLYSEWGNLMITLNGNNFYFKKDEYFKLNETDYSDALDKMDFNHYTIRFQNEKYLISRAKPNTDRLSTNNNIYYVMSLSNRKTNYAFGSFGFCDNIFGDYNKDGKLDIVMIDLLKQESSNYDNINGLFKAKIFTFENGKFIPTKNKKGALECTYYSYNGEIKILSGNWYY